MEKGSTKQKPQAGNPLEEFTIDALGADLSFRANWTCVPEVFNRAIEIALKKWITDPRINVEIGELFSYEETGNTAREIKKRKNHINYKVSGFSFDEILDKIPLTDPSVGGVRIVIEMKTTGYAYIFHWNFKKGLVRWKD